MTTGRTRNERIAKSLQLGRDRVDEGQSVTILRAECVVGCSDGLNRGRAAIGKPVGGRFSTDPAVDLAYRIRASLRAPDPMPELRRRLRELREGTGA